MSYIKNLSLDAEGRVHKVLVWSTKRNSWASVSSANRNGKEFNEVHGTFQIIEDGDLIFHAFEQADKSLMIHAGEFRYSENVTIDNEVSVRNLGLLPLPPSMPIHHMLNNLTHQAKSWLNVMSRTDGFLPPGVGWDGVLTLYDQRKRDAIRGIFFGVNDELLISTLVDAGQISTRSNAPTNWKNESIALPQTEPCYLGWGESETTERVFAVVFYKNNETEVFKYDVVDGKVNGNELSKWDFIVPNQAQRVIIGTINAGIDPAKPLAKWRLFTR